MIKLLLYQTDPAFTACFISLKTIVTCNGAIKTFVPISLTSISYSPLPMISFCAVKTLLKLFKFFYDVLFFLLRRF